MLDDAKPYPAYKDSGHPWLGDVPEHWEVRRIKQVLREVDRRSGDGHGTLLSLSKSRGLLPQAELTDKAHAASSLDKYKLYEPGQIVMNRMQAWNGLFGTCEQPGLVSPDYSVFRILDDTSLPFLMSLLRTPRIVGEFALLSKGIGTGFEVPHSQWAREV